MTHNDTPIARGNRLDGDSKPAIAIIDGSNVAHQGGKQARLRYLNAVIAEAKDHFENVLVVADASLRHKIDDKQGYEALTRAGKVCQAPAGTTADTIIVEIARRRVQRGWMVTVLTNDLGIGRMLPVGSAKASVFSSDIGAETDAILILPEGTHRIATAGQAEGA